MYHREGLIDVKPIPSQNPVRGLKPPFERTGGEGHRLAQRHDMAALLSFDGSSVKPVLVEAEVRAVSLVAVDVASDDAQPLALAEGDDVVETVLAQVEDPTLRAAVLPTCRRGLRSAENQTRDRIGRVPAGN